MQEFRVSDFKRVELADEPLLRPRLTASREQSCEFNFANLYVWGFAFLTRWQEYNGHLYFFPEVARELMVLEDGAPVSAEELLEVSRGMRLAGFPGIFHHLRKEFLDNVSGWDRFFRAELLADGLWEYLYRVDSLAELHGSKLGKKRNLISQFKRDFPDYEVRPLTPEILPACLELAREWRTENADPDQIEIRHEAVSLPHLADGLDRLGMEGRVILTGGRVAAFSMYSRINADLFTEHFEKSLHECKGAAQIINQETALALRGVCTYLNREQDLGRPGLRQAKMSYAPDFLLKNYALIPLE